MTWDILFWIGRIFFALIFIMNGLGHFMKLDSMSQYAEAKGVAAPRIAVPVAGLMSLAGGLSILFWAYVGVGSMLLFVFLGLTAVKMHDFWNVEDPMEAQTEQAHFMKNVALMGASVIFYVLAAGGGSLPS